MSEGRLRYQPGLDGLRALALIAMLAFHDDRLQGGFLGLTTFFTLSGFLITGLILSEFGSTNRVSLGRFFARRSRRLLPAALIGILVAAGVSVALRDGQTSLNFRYDALSALAEVANWRFLVSGREYANLLATPSPLLHYWSLSVEEQFYLLLAPLIVALLALARGSRKVMAGALVTLAVLSFVDGWFMVNRSVDRAYYGTDTRALEFLIGSLLAVVMSRRTLTKVQSRTVASIGPVVLVALAVGTVIAEVTDVGLFRGGLLLFACGSGLVVLAACEPGPVRWLCSIPVLIGLGRISYGVYIFHWPVFIWLNRARTGLDPQMLTVVRMTVTIGLAVVCYVLVEQPIRQRRFVKGQRTRWVAVPAAMSVAALGALVVGAAAPPLVANFAPEASQAAVLREARRQEQASPKTQPVASHTEDSSPERGGAPRPVKRIMIVGDSVALTLGRGIERWGAQNGVAVLNDGLNGCPLLVGADVRGYWGVATRPADMCQSDRRWPTYLAEFKPDLVLALYGAWDVYDASFDRGKTWVSAGMPEFDRFYRGQVEGAAEQLGATGAHVLWLTPPCFGANSGSLDPDAVWYDPQRVEVLARIEHEVAAENGMAITDIAHDGGCPVDFGTRPDGVHYSDSGADETTDRLVPLLRQVPGVSAR
jgi:peptidoglycan/LPS O-acetylase OafA/YrhL